MQVLPIDLTEIIAVIMGISLVLIPILGITARFALKPTVEALARIFETRGTDETVQILERRIALMESHIENLESAQRRLAETTRFDAQLLEGRENPPLPGGGSGS